MKRHKNIFDRLTTVAALDGQPLPGVPLVEIAGCQRVLVENHSGVTEYSHTRICVCMKYGRLLLSGSALELSQMSRHQLVITGRIDSVIIERSGS